MINDIRPEILEFASKMEEKMRQFDRSRGNSWKYCDDDYILFRLNEEISEYKKSATREKRAQEAVDIGNFAMMAWWVSYNSQGKIGYGKKLKIEHSPENLSRGSSL